MKEEFKTFVQIHKKELAAVGLIVGMIVYVEVSTKINRAKSIKYLNDLVSESMKVGYDLALTNVKAEGLEKAVELGKEMVIQRKGYVHLI